MDFLNVHNFWLLLNGLTQRSQFDSIIKSTNATFVDVTFNHKLSVLLAVAISIFADTRFLIIIFIIIIIHYHH